jgi:hypothetical protein
MEDIFYILWGLGLLIFFSSPFFVKAGAPIAAIDWNWGNWWNCTFNTFVKGCSAFVYRCVVTGTGYIECVVTGCAAVFIGAAIGCAARQLIPC